jgi:uncharacterized protein (TIGR02271 family)
MESAPLPLAVVVTTDGFRGVIDSEVLPLAEQSAVAVRFEHGERLIIPVNFLDPRQDGTYVLTMNFGEAFARRRETPSRAETLTIPVAEERLVRQKRKVETGRVRVTKRVSTRVEQVDDPLVQETVHVERVVVNRPVDEPVPARYEGDTLIIPVFEETLVVRKQLVLKEELRVTRRRTELHRPQQVTSRREEVSVERFPPRSQREADLERPDV